MRRGILVQIACFYRFCAEEHPGLSYNPACYFDPGYEPFPVMADSLQGPAFVIMSAIAIAE